MKATTKEMVFDLLRGKFDRAHYYSDMEKIIDTAEDLFGIEDENVLELKSDFEFEKSRTCLNH